MTRIILITLALSGCEMMQKDQSNYHKLSGDLSCEVECGEAKLRSSTMIERDDSDKDKTDERSLGVGEP